MALFALDHNYPAPIVERAKPYLSGVDLVYIGDIDPRLPVFEDWELLLALHHDSREWDGMISNDTSMLDQERELAVLGYTQLTLIAPVAAGHDPIRSTGLVLAHIENIAVNGHREFPRGGHPTSPLAATTSPHRWPSDLPA